MNPISENTIYNAFEEIGNLNQEESQKLVNNWSETQPNILFYLFTFGKDILNETEKQLQFFLGIVICHSFTMVNDKLKLIEQNTIINNEEKNRQFFSLLNDKSPEEANKLLDGIIADYPQADLFKVMLITVMDEFDNDESQIQEENLNSILICLKTIIDSFTE